jgi:NADH pyrophosphatase NudC (nudix superfamily)
VVVVAATISVVLSGRGEKEKEEEEQDSAICSYCNYHFFNYCTPQLVMTVYEINVLVKESHNRPSVAPRVPRG